MSIASEPKHCPKCQTPLPGDAPQGLCPKCLLAAAAIPTEAGQPAPDKTPPGLAELAAAFPQLEILELIGQGGMGFVFKARQPKLDRFVALKILPQSLAADPAFAERFSREGRVLAKLNHPNIVTIHDFGAADTQLSTLNSQPFYYLLMEFVDGVNLRQAMQAGRFTPDQALAIVPKICEALQFAHNEGILHRDIKPENILLDAKGRVKIADFGIAKLLERGSVTRSASDSSDASHSSELALPDDAAAGHRPALHALTETGKALGTPNYMAPEQQECPGEVDHRADIYSLGVVFYEMLTGELPLGRFAPPSQKSTADPRVDEVVLRALEKERERRQHSAGEVKTQVETIAATPDSGRRRGDESQTEKQSADKDKSQSLLTSSPTGVAPRFSRTAIVGACWTGFAGVVFILQNIGINVGAIFLIPDKLLVALSVMSPIGVTLLGWIAVSEIRRSAGKLHGLWLAVFDGLLFPLLALNILVGWIVLAVLLAVASLLQLKGSPGTFGVLLLSLPILIPLNRYIVRRVWRAVNQGRPDTTPVGTITSQHQQRQKKSWFSIELLRWAVLGLLVVAIAGTFMQPLVGKKARTKAATADRTNAYWVDHLRLNQPVEPGSSSGMSRYGNEAFSYETSFDGKSCALTICYRQEHSNKYRVLIEEKGGPRRSQNAIVKSIQSKWRYDMVEEKMLMGREEFDRISAFVLQQKTANQPAGRLGFTLVRERTVEVMATAPHPNWFDLDIGQNVPPGRFNSEADFAKYAERMKNLGADFRVVEEGNRLGIDAGNSGCLFTPVNRPDWDSLIADQLPGVVSSLTNRVMAPWLLSERELSATLAFKTREGGMGLLQLTGFTDNPRGVKIRYKLVQNGLLNAANSPHLSEPSYQGRKLLDWLAEVDYGKPPELRAQAGEAIRRMGTNIIPFLLADLGDGNPLHVKYDGQDRRSPDERLRQATWAFDALGAAGKPAIPQLEKLLAVSPGYVPSALAGIGRDALPKLLNALTNDVFWVRDNAAGAIANGIYGERFSGFEAVAALPIALSNLSYTNATNSLYQANTRARAADLIKAIRSDPALKALEIKQQP